VIEVSLLATIPNNMSTSDLAAALPKIPPSARGWGFMLWYGSSGKGLWLVLPSGSHLHGGMPLFSIMEICDHIGMARKHRGQATAGVLTPTGIYRCEAFLPMPPL